MTKQKDCDKILPNDKGEVSYCYCRRCQKVLSSRNFYDSVDGGFIDSNGLLSVCKSCIIEMYNEVFQETDSMEKTIHKLCTSLNIMFSNDAVDATKEYAKTLLEQGKNVNSVFGIYKGKLIAVQKTMDKDVNADMTYKDVGVVIEEKDFSVEKPAIPDEVRDFWGWDISEEEDIRFLEQEYRNFKTSHRAETHSEVVLLKQVCYTMLEIKHTRAAGDDSTKLVKELQSLMDALTISPQKSKDDGKDDGAEAYGLWLKDIEEHEPTEWLRKDPRGEIFRDVNNVDGYFQKYFVRPMKNFVMNSRDFNVTEEDGEEIFDVGEDFSVDDLLEDIEEKSEEE